MLPVAATEPPTGEAALAGCREAVRLDAAKAMSLCRAVQQAAIAMQQPRDAGLALLDRASAGIALARYDEVAGDLDTAATLLQASSQWLDLHRLERQRGTLAFRREELAKAALHYGRSLNMALVHDDIAAQAQGWNDVGIVHRRIGDHAQALQAFTTSLSLRERLGQADQAAAVLNNLGNMQMDLGDYAAAEPWLQRALAAYRERDAPRQIAHVLESLGMNDHHLGRDESARAQLAQAWQAFALHDAARDQLRVATHLARLESRLGNRTAALAWIDRAHALLGPLQQAPTLGLLLVQAQTQAEPGKATRARRALRERLSAVGDDVIADQVEAWQFLAQASEYAHDKDQALTDLKALQATISEQGRRAQNERVAQWQVRLDVAERLRQIEALREQNRLQAQHLENGRLRQRLLLAMSLCGLITVAAVLQLRLQRQRAAADAQRLALEHQNAGYRAAADALRADRRRLQTLADRSADALLLLDARGSVLAANRAATRLLGAPGSQLAGLPLAQLLGAAAQAVSSEIAARENDDEDDGTRAPLLLYRPDGTRLHARAGVLSEADAEEPVGWLQLQAEPLPLPVPSVDANTHASDGVDAAASEPLRRGLVELMRATLEIWEQSTRRSRVEFAEQSGIWRVHIDDGRLRMRSLERYLSVTKLPRLPRWREVLRSAYFVLAECTLDTAQRAWLETLIGAVRAAQRKGAGGRGGSGTAVTASQRTQAP